MPQAADTVHARFATPLRHNENLLQKTPLPLIAALHSIYPFLIASNRILGNITWTNNDYYRNTALILFTSLILLHWNNYLIIFMPFLVVLIFCCYAWFIKRTIIDVNRDNEIPPTIDEILVTLDNFTARFSFAFDPYGRSISISKLLTNVCLLTPFYVIVMKNFVTPTTWIVISLVFVLTYFSSWCLATRKLLWRLKTVRKIAEFITGDNFAKVDKDLELSIFNMKSKGSIDEKTHIIEFQVEENERRWIGLGWTKRMLFTDKKSAYYDTYSQKGMRKLEDFSFPILRGFPHSKWRWIDRQWHTATDWTYTDNWWKHPQEHDSLTAFTRTRSLKRECVVVPLV